MKHGKWLFLLALSALFVIAASAVMAQSTSAPSAVGQQLQVPHGQGTPNPNWPPHDGNWNGNGNGDDHHHHHRHPFPPPSTVSEPLTCTLATQLQGMTQAEVAQTFSSLRSAIGSTDVLAVMPHGAIVTIVSGPECSGGTYWYEVTYNGQTGWVTEGGDGEYWLEPVPGAMVTPVATVTAG